MESRYHRITRIRVFHRVNGINEVALDLCAVCLFPYYEENRARSFTAAIMR